MEFTRARSPQQKNIRIQQIIRATCELYEILPYDQITLASIAEKLNFSRANLYKYVSSKEEIFLWILSDDLDHLVDDLTHTLSQQEELSIHQFALFWSQTLYRHQRLLRLLSILFTVIEKKATALHLAHFKTRLFKGTQLLYPTIQQHLGFLSHEQILHFLQYQLYYAAGFFPSTLQNNIQREAVKLSKTPFAIEDFVTAYSQFISIMIQGMRRPEL